MDESEKNNNNFKMLFDQAPLGYQSLDIDGNFIEVNQKWLDTLGYKKEEVIGKWFGDFLTPEYKEAFKKNFQKFKDQGHIHSEFEMVHKNGNILFIAFEGKIGNDTEGHFKQTHCILEDITEKIRDQRNLEIALEMLKNAGRIAKFGGWNVILSENRSYWSDEVAAIHEMPAGYSPLLEDGINFYAPEWREKITQIFTDCAQKGIPYDEEMEILTSKGKRVWVRTNGEAVRDENGVIYKIQGGFQDITEQKIAEQKFKELMKRHKTFIDTVPDIIIEVDSNKIYTWANKAGYEFFGDDVIGKEASYYFEGDQHTYEKVQPLFEGDEEIIYLESYQKRKDGKIRLLAWWCKVYKDSDGNAVGAISSARDITERRELENSLIRSEEKLRMVMDGVTVPIVFVDADLRYNFVNKAYADWYNTTKEEIEGKYIKDILAEDVYKRALPNYQTVLNGQQVSFDNRTMRDGKEKFVSVRMIPYYNKDKIVGFFSSITDITESKLAEIELKKKNRELEETNSVMIGRELRMIELKKEVNELLSAAGKKEKYEI